VPEARHPPPAETVAFPFDGEKKDSKSFISRKAHTVIETARWLSRFCDVYKAEFPGTLGVESESQLLDNLRALDQACERPWVLLSAGVDFPQYKQQVEMAAKCAPAVCSVAGRSGRSTSPRTVRRRGGVRARRRRIECGKSTRSSSGTASSVSLVRPQD
jgi:tagatose-1,6-bisphosphate aldolase